MFTGFGLKSEGDKKQTGELWSTSASFSFAYNNFNPNIPQKTFWMSSNSTINVTENWKVKYNARFDLIKQNLVSHTFSIYRDLHCWEMSVNWTPKWICFRTLFKTECKIPNLKI